MERELNSVNDNPIVDPEKGEMLFAGNFYGGHVALTMDLLKIAGSLRGRPDGSAICPAGRLPAQCRPARNTGRLRGLRRQGSATDQQRPDGYGHAARHPDTLLSRPTEANNQDKVSMGQNAALNAAEVITLLQEVLASLLVALSNAASFT